MTHHPIRPVILCILDGWGHSTHRAHNAIALGNTPVFDRFWNNAPHSLLDCSGKKVGLPEGQMGNSEVGHMTIGSGRIVLQDLPRIDQAIADGDLDNNETVKTFIAKLKQTRGRAHLMGLISPGGVHSHQSHIVALARHLAQNGIPVCLHAFLDGRDTPPKSALSYIDQLISAVSDQPNIQISTVSGRYYAMDRDKRWERTYQAFSALVSGQGEKADNAHLAIEKSYKEDITDEFILPHVIGQYSGMVDGDGLLMGNFRADRARQILTALVDHGFTEFERPYLPTFAAQTGMVSYSKDLDQRLDTIFAPQDIRNGLGETVASAGLRQLRIAETEKYAHVTFFLNGGSEAAYPGEERILVPSPKVATYDLQPEMSAKEVTDKLIEALQTKKFDLLIVNYANPDMVGHTGKLDAAIAAVECIDGCLGQIEQEVLAQNGIMLVTADHGNCEQMAQTEGDEDGSSGAHTAHTLNPVPLLLVGNHDMHLRSGSLSDIAPSVLDLLGIEAPAAMTGTSLISYSEPVTKKHAEEEAR